VLLSLWLKKLKGKVFSSEFTNSEISESEHSSLALIGLLLSSLRLNGSLNHLV
jgi:hypothetical protein